MKDVHFLITLVDRYSPSAYRYLITVTHFCSSDTFEELENYSREDLLEYVDECVLPKLDYLYSSCVPVDVRLIDDVVKSKREEDE